MKYTLSVTVLFLIGTVSYHNNLQVGNKQYKFNLFNLEDRSTHNKQVQQYKPENINNLSDKTDDNIIFQAIIQKSIDSKLQNKPIEEIIQVVAEGFLNAKYKAGLLDRYEQESLVISLKEFDCLLFIETVLALSQSIALQDYSYQTFTNNIVNLRYWNSHLNGYCSRLHYFSEWIYDNQKRNNLNDISISLGGRSQKKKLDFMSKHRNLYPRLINNNANYQCIVEMESNLTNQGIPTNYIPKQEIRNIYKQLKPGDIIGVTTNIAGLDVTHTGLVYFSSDDEVGLIHASPIGKVTINPDLQNYVNRVKNSTGILVARLIDPRTKN